MKLCEVKLGQWTYFIFSVSLFLSLASWIWCVQFVYVSSTSNVCIHNIILHAFCGLLFRVISLALSLPLIRSFLIRLLSFHHYFVVLFCHVCLQCETVHAKMVMILFSFFSRNFFKFRECEWRSNYCGKYMSSHGSSNALKCMKSIEWKSRLLSTYAIKC